MMAATNSSEIDFLLASVSPFATSNSAAGHFFWMYQFLHNSQGVEPRPLTICIKGQDNSSHLLGLLSADRPKNRLHIGPSKSLEHDREALLNWLSGAAGRAVTHVQCYDGTLRELMLFLMVAPQVPDVQFVFNFHWATDWIKLRDSSHRRHRILIQQLLRAVRRASPNLHFSAESEVLAKAMASFWGVKVSVYPIYAMFHPQRELAWENRDTDVLFVPQRSHEIEHCSEIAGTLNERGVSTSIALVPEMKVRARGSSKLESSLEQFDTIIELPLPDDGYQNLFQSHRIVVLPYLKDYFRWGSSGKFNEAISLGTFPLVPENTAIASQSALAPELHQYSPLRVEQACEQILSRLKAGFPNNLSGIKLEDFFEWVRGFTSSPEEFVTSPKKLRSGRTIRALELLEDKASEILQIGHRLSTYWSNR